MPPLPGLHLVVGILPAVETVETAGYKPFAAPRLHHEIRIPASAELPAESGFTHLGAAEFAFIDREAVQA